MFLLSVGWLKKGVLVLALLSQTNQKKHRLWRKDEIHGHLWLQL